MSCPPIHAWPNRSLARWILVGTRVACGCLAVLLPGATCYGVADAPLPAAADTALPLSASGWNEEVKQSQREAAKRLAADLSAAVKRGDKTFAAPVGDYRFGNGSVTGLQLDNAQNLVIDAVGSTFWFEDPRARVDRIVLKHCRGVTFHGGTMDFDPLPFSQGKIVSINTVAQELVIRIDDGFPLPDDTWVTPKNVGAVKAMFCAKDGLFRAAPLDWVSELEPVGESNYRVRLKGNGIFRFPAGVEVGDRMVLPDRSGRFVFVLEGCESTTLDGVTIYAAPQMAFVEHAGHGGNVYRNCKVVRRPGSARLLACSADIFHSAKVERGPTIENCEFADTCDDIVTVHSFFSPVIKDSEADTVSILDLNSPDIEEGCELEFYHYKTVAPAGRAKVLKVAPRNDFTADELAIPAALRAQGYRVADPTGSYRQPLTVTLDRPLPVKRFDLVVSSLSQARGTIMRNNYFHDSSAGSGAHVNCVDGTVAHNRIQRTGGPAILSAAEHLFWEGPFAHHLTITDNEIEGAPMLPNLRQGFSGLQAAIAVCVRGIGFTYPHADCTPMSDVLIASNQIRQTSGNAIFVSNVQGAVIRDNVLETGLLPAPPGASAEAGNKAYPIFVAFSSGVEISGNELTNPPTGTHTMIGAQGAKIHATQPSTNLAP